MFVKLLEDIVILFKNYNMERVSTCCGADLLLNNGDPICSECKEHCDIEEPSN